MVGSVPPFRTVVVPPVWKRDRAPVPAFAAKEDRAAACTVVRVSATRQDIVYFRPRAPFSCPKMGKNMIRPIIQGIFAVVLMVLFSGLPVLGQNDEILIKWNSRAESITNSLAVELSKLPSADKCLGYAKLGETWWKSDTTTGLKWLTTATDLALSPSSDFKDDNQKLDTLRKLVEIVATRDAILTRKIALKLSETGKDLSEKQEEANVDAILKAATALLKVDVNMAFELAAQTARSNHPVYSFSSLIFAVTLSKKNSDLANRYISLAISSARKKQVAKLYPSLIRTAFPQITGDQYATFVSEQNQKEMLEGLAVQFAAEGAQALQATGSFECPLTDTYATSLHSRYEAAVPELTPIVDQAVSTCSARSSKPSVDAGSQETSKQTVEDLVEAANKTVDLAKKADLLLRASIASIPERKYQFAFETLLSIDERYRSTPVGMWEATLMQAAPPMMFEKFRADDFAAVESDFRQIPRENRPLIRVELAYKLQKDDGQLAKDMLFLARKDLNETELKPIRNVQILFSSPELFCAISELYRKLGSPIDAIETFEEAIPAINRYIAQAPDNERISTISTLPITWSRFSTFDAEFLDTYFFRIDSGISKISYKPVQREVTFGFLRSTLNKLAGIQKDAEIKLQPQKSKKS